MKLYNKFIIILQTDFVLFFILTDLVYLLPVLICFNYLHMPNVLYWFKKELQSHFQGIFVFFVSPNPTGGGNSVTFFQSEMCNNVKPKNQIIFRVHTGYFILILLRSIQFNFLFIHGFKIKKRDSEQ